VKDTSAKTPPKPAVLPLAQLLTEQPAAPPPGWIEPGLLPPQGILLVGGEPKVGKSLLVANLALALAAGKDRAGFRIPAARRVLVCQFELPTPQFVSRLASMPCRWNFAKRSFCANWKNCLTKKSPTLFGYPWGR